MVEYAGQITFHYNNVAIVLDGRKRILPVDAKAAELLVASGVGAQEGRNVYYCGAAEVDLNDGTILQVPSDGRVNVRLSDVKNAAAFKDADAQAISDGPSE
jgi:hypothetical protein